MGPEEVPAATAALQAAEAERAALELGREASRDLPRQEREKEDARKELRR